VVATIMWSIVGLIALTGGIGAILAAVGLAKGGY